MAGLRDEVADRLAEESDNAALLEQFGTMHMSQTFTGIAFGGKAKR